MDAMLYCNILAEIEALCVKGRLFDAVPIEEEGCACPLNDKICRECAKRQDCAELCPQIRLEH